MGVLFCLGRRTEGVQVVSGKHLSVSVYANFAGREPTPDACRADYGANGGAAALRGVVLSFGAKESTKESQRHGDYGKKPFIAHFDGGARNVARNGVR